MHITFETEITPDGVIKLPVEFQTLADRRVSVTITDEIDTEANARKARIMSYAGIWKGLSDVDLGLDDIQERRENFFNNRKVDP